MFESQPGETPFGKVFPLTNDISIMVNEARLCSVLRNVELVASSRPCPVSPPAYHDGCEILYLLIWHTTAWCRLDVGDIYIY